MILAKKIHIYLGGCETVCIGSHYLEDCLSSEIRDQIRQQSVFLLKNEIAYILQKIGLQLKQRKISKCFSKKENSEIDGVKNISAQTS